MVNNWNCGLLSINSCVLLYGTCVTLWHMSICARIIISVALKQVDYAPDTKSGTERDNEGLQNGNCLIKKFHITSLSAAFCGGKKMFVLDFG